MTVGTNIQTVNFNNVQPKMQTNFKAQTATLKDYPPNTIEINDKKKTGMSNGAKVGIGLGILGTAALAIGLIMKGRGSQAKEVVKHINFKEAKTIEEAKKFAMDNFGMKLEVNDNLTAANFFNEICSNVNNKLNGRAVLPKKIVFIDNVKKDNWGTANMGWVDYNRTLNVYSLPQGLLNMADKKGTNILKNPSIYQNEFLIMSAYHELGHTQHYAFCKNAAKMGDMKELIERGVSDKHYLEEFLQEIKKSDIQKACNDFFTSDYYQESPAEFIAETFAWKMMGKNTPIEIEELYLKYGGVPISKK